MLHGKGLKRDVPLAQQGVESECTLFLSNPHGRGGAPSNAAGGANERTPPPAAAVRATDPASCRTRPVRPPRGVSDASGGGGGGLKDKWLSAGNFVEVNYEGTWHNAQVVGGVHSGLKVNFLESRTGTVISWDDVADRVRKPTDTLHFPSGCQPRHAVDASSAVPGKGWASAADPSACSDGCGGDGDSACRPTRKQPLRGGTKATGGPSPAAAAAAAKGGTAAAIARVQPAAAAAAASKVRPAAAAAAAAKGGAAAAAESDAAAARTVGPRLW